MRVRFRFHCADLPDFPGDPDSEVPDGATVGEALTAYARARQLDGVLDQLLTSMYLIGKKPAGTDTVLRDGDELVVMRILHGG